MLVKESFISIKKNYKRYISLVLIILLGVGFYAGIKASSPDMKNTLNHFYQQHNLYDFQLISELGILEKDVTELKNAGYRVEAIHSFDAIIKKQEENAVKVYSYDKNSKIKTMKAHSLSIIRNHPGVMHLDGEPIMADSRIDISMIPHSLKVFTPESVSFRKEVHELFGEISRFMDRRLPFIFR